MVSACLLRFLAAPRVSLAFWRLAELRMPLLWHMACGIIHADAAPLSGLPRWMTSPSSLCSTKSLPMASASCDKIIAVGQQRSTVLAHLSFFLSSYLPTVDLTFERRPMTFNRQHTYMRDRIQTSCSSCFTDEAPLWSANDHEWCLSVSVLFGRRRPRCPSTTNFSS